MPNKPADVKIRSALIKLMQEVPLKSISVSELCRTAGVPRSSFYYHYQEISDVIEEILNQTFSALPHEIHQIDGPSGVSRAILLQNARVIAQCFKARESQLRVILESDAAPMFDSAFEEQFDRYYGLTDLAKSNGGGYGPLAREYLYAGQMAMLKKWVLGGCEEPVEDIANALASLDEAIFRHASPGGRSE
jgi:AcrR family transcriptional regulator